jgi:hypothetical protein
MHKNTPFRKTSFLRSLIIAALMTLGVACNTEARVTKEVAEATILFLLEAVGIPPTGVPATDNARRDAIVRMLYTDAGQQEMCDWATHGTFPPLLTTAGFITADTYQVDQSNLQRLFPCQPGGTFTSYATNTDRLRYCIHGNINNIHKICAALINKTPNTITGSNKDKIKEVINLFPVLATKSVDQKLAIVVFILDICDTPDQIFNILDI